MMKLVRLTAGLFGLFATTITFLVAVIPGDATPPSAWIAFRLFMTAATRSTGCERMVASGRVSLLAQAMILPSSVREPGVDMVCVQDTKIYGADDSADAVRGHIDWKYAFGSELDDPVKNHLGLSQ
jgi:hypothetical protein